MTTAIARRPPRVLFASVPIGSGHRRATEATRRALDAAAPGAVTKHVDVMEYVKPFARDIVLDGYATLLTLAPRVWGYLYDHDAWLQKLAPIENFKRHFQRDRFEALVRDFAPDIYVSSHPLCTVPMAAMKGSGAEFDPKFRIPIVTIVTDFHLHESWVQKGVTIYCVGHEELTAPLTQRTVRPEQVRALGIPVARSFAPDAKDVAALKTRFGLDPAKPVALFLLKGLDTSFLEKAVFQVSLLNRPTEILFNTAGNEALAALLRRSASMYGVRAKMFGFVDNLDDYVAVSDVVTTKPGGSTSAECLALGVPMLLVEPIPGQEERNSTFLVTRGVARRVTNVLTLGAELEVLLAGGPDMTRMRERTKALGRPKAADELGALLVGIAADPEEFLKLEEPPEEIPAPRERVKLPPEPGPEPPPPPPQPKKPVGELEEIGESWGPSVGASDVAATPATARRQHYHTTTTSFSTGLSPRATREYLGGLILVEKDLARRLDEARDDLAKWEKRAALARGRGEMPLVSEAERRLSDARAAVVSYSAELDRILAKKAAVKGVPYSAPSRLEPAGTSGTAWDRRDETPLRLSDDPEGAFRDLEVDAELKALKDKLDKK